MLSYVLDLDPWGMPTNFFQRAVALLFDDLFNWNSWLWANRREAPRGLLSWGSNPYPYAPDGTPTALHGCGGGCANLESGLDNGPVMDGTKWD